MLKLHPVIYNNGTKHWCGPTAVAAVTGFDVRTVTQCIRAVNNKQCVMGTTGFQLAKALEALGIRATIRWTSGKPTLAAWARQNRALFAQQPVIVGLTHHWVTVCGRRFVDSYTNGEPVPLSEAPHRRARVVYFLVLQELPQGATWKAPVQPKPDYAAARARAGVLELAKQHGIQVYAHNLGEWFVYPPDSISTAELDPYYEEHLAYDADDRAQRIRRYVSILQARQAQPDEICLHHPDGRLELADHTK